MYSISTSWFMSLFTAVYKRMPHICTYIQSLTYFHWFRSYIESGFVNQHKSVTFFQQGESVFLYPDLTTSLVGDFVETPSGDVIMSMATLKVVSGLQANQTLIEKKILNTYIHRSQDSWWGAHLSRPNRYQPASQAGVHRRRRRVHT
jgi:hypothetical protein